MFKKYLFALTLLCFPIMAYAFDLSNLYVKALAGYNHFLASNGYAVGGAVGYKYRLFRLEGEVIYRKNTLDQVIVHDLFLNQKRVVNTEFDVNSLAYMANFLFDSGFSLKILPYFGIGAGVYQEWCKGDLTCLAEGADCIVNCSFKHQSAAGQAVIGLHLLHFPWFRCNLEYHCLSIWPDNCLNHTIAGTFCLFF